MIDNKIVFKKTHDDWYGNYPDGKVRIKYHGNIDYRQLSNETALYRVSVWGTDDFGMYFDTVDERETEELFMVISRKSFIDKEDLDSLGFSIF